LLGAACSLSAQIFDIENLQAPLSIKQHILLTAILIMWHKLGFKRL